MNISSIVVKTEPEKMAGVIESLKNSGLCEVHFHDQTGKIIVTLEGENISEEMKKMKAILNMTDVLSADLAYSYSENEMLETIECMKTADAVPDMLKEDSSGDDDPGTTW